MWPDSSAMTGFDWKWEMNKWMVSNSFDPRAIPFSVSVTGKCLTDCFPLHDKIRP